MHADKLNGYDICSKKQVDILELIEMSDIERLFTESWEDISGY